MKNVGDKELTMILLDEHKLCASSLTNLVLESSCQDVRNDCQNILNRTFQHQKQIFDLMTSKGWYATQTASEQEISSAKQEIGKVQQTFTNM